MENREVIEWVPDRRTAWWMNIVGLILTIGGTVGYAALFLWTQSGYMAVELGVAELFGMLAMSVGIFALAWIHELLHGFALRTLGFKPKYGALMIGGIIPAFYCTSLGAVMSRGAFVYVALLPGIVLGVVPIVWILAQWPGSGWLVIPAGLLLGGAVGDIFLTIRVLTAPRGTRVEDIRDGVRLHLPVGSSVS